MKYVLAILALIYLILPTGGVVELVPDFLPVVAHLDELAASFLLTRVFTGDTGEAADAPPGWFELVIFIILGAAATLYLIFPTAGLIEFIPDAIPIVGNLDELVASVVIFAMTRRIDRATLTANPANLNAAYTTPSHKETPIMSDADTPTPHAIEVASERIYSTPPPPPEMGVDAGDASATHASAAEPPQLNQTHIYQRSNTTCLQFFAGFALLILVCGGVTIAAIVASGNALGDIFDFGFLPESMVSVDYTQPIVTSLSASATLVTFEGQYTIDEVRVNYEGGVLNAAGFGMTFEVDAEIAAGFDLRDESAFRVTRLPGNRYVVQLPPPELAQCSITDVDVEDRSTRVLVTISEQDMEQLARHTAIDGIIDKAIAQGLLEEAKKEARVVVRRIVGEIVGDEAQIEIQFTDPPVQVNAATIVRDNTCFFEIPTRFTYDPEHDVWRVD